MTKSPFRSISLTIVVSSVAVLLSIAVLVGWTLLVLQNQTLREALAEKVGDNTWVLVSGVVALSVIILVLVGACVVLVREIVEVRRQTTFIDSVTHELKSPLASLKLGLETYARPGVNAVQLEGLRQMMLDDVERLTLFVDDILVASQVASGPFELRHDHSSERIDLRLLVEHCVGQIERRHHLPVGAIAMSFGPHLDDEGNTTRRHDDDRRTGGDQAVDTVELVSDEVALEIILKNLLDNAVKYSAEEVGPAPIGDAAGARLVERHSAARVEVLVRRLADRRGRVQIEVHDRGIGMETQHLQRIFARFYRVPSEAVRQRRGTGLGLYVVSRLVRRLGGRLRAFSRGQGRGTCMRVVLPSGLPRTVAGRPV